MKIEASVLLGDRDEEVEFHGEPDCWDFGRGVMEISSLTCAKTGGSLHLRLPGGVDLIRSPKIAIDAFTTIHSRELFILKAPLN